MSFGGVGESIPECCLGAASFILGVTPGGQG